jgi:hypothetical protein
MGENFVPVEAKTLSSILRHPETHNAVAVDLTYRDHRVLQNDNEHTYHIVYEGKRGIDLALCELSYSVITRRVDIKLVTRDWMQTAHFYAETFAPLVDKNLTILCTRRGTPFALHSPELTLYNRHGRPRKIAYKIPEVPRAIAESISVPEQVDVPVETAVTIEPEVLLPAPVIEQPITFSEAADYIPAPDIHKPTFVIPAYVEPPRPVQKQMPAPIPVSLERILEEPLSMEVGGQNGIHMKRAKAVRTAAVARALYTMTKSEEYVTEFVQLVQREFHAVGDVLNARLPTDALFNIIAKSTLSSDHKQKVTLAPVLPPAIESHIQDDWLPLQYALSAATVANVSQMRVRLWIDRELENENSEDVKKESETLVRVPALIKHLTIAATRAA